MKKKKEEKDKIPGYIFVGILFVGIAIGLLLGSVGIGALLGLGGGFLSRAIYVHVTKKNENESKI